MFIAVALLLSATPLFTPVAETAGAYSFGLNQRVKSVVLVRYESKNVAAGQVRILVNGVDVGAVPADSDRPGRTRDLLVQGGPTTVRFQGGTVSNFRVSISLYPELPAETITEMAQRFFDKGRATKEPWAAFRLFERCWLILEGLEKPIPLQARARAEMLRVQPAGLEPDE